MKFDLKNALIGGLIALLVIFVAVALICLVVDYYSAAGFMAILAGISTFILCGIWDE